VRRFVPNAEWLSVAQIARELGVSEQTVVRWIADGKLAAIKPGQSYRVRRCNFERFADRYQVHPQGRKRHSQQKKRSVNPEQPYLSPGEEAFNAILVLAGQPPRPPENLRERGRRQLEALAEMRRLASRSEPDLPEGFEKWPREVQQRYWEEFHALYFPLPA
jgi:excisionase family DNA binding protein